MCIILSLLSLEIRIRVCWHCIAPFTHLLHSSHFAKGETDPQNWSGTLSVKDDSDIVRGFQSTFPAQNCLLYQPYYYLMYIRVFLKSQVQSLFSGHQQQPLSIWVTSLLFVLLCLCLSQLRESDLPKSCHPICDVSNYGSKPQAAGSLVYTANLETYLLLLCSQAQTWLIVSVLVPATAIIVPCIFPLGKAKHPLHVLCTHFVAISYVPGYMMVQQYTRHLTYEIKEHLTEEG